MKFLASKIKANQRDGIIIGYPVQRVGPGRLEIRGKEASSMFIQETKRE